MTTNLAPERRRLVASPLTTTPEENETTAPEHVSSPAPETDAPVESPNPPPAQAGRDAERMRLGDASNRYLREQLQTQVDPAPTGRPTETLTEATFIGDEPAGIPGGAREAMDVSDALSGDSELGELDDSERTRLLDASTERWGDSLFSGGDTAIQTLANQARQDDAITEDVSTAFRDRALEIHGDSSRILARDDEEASTFAANAMLTEPTADFVERMSPEQATAFVSSLALDHPDVRDEAAVPATMRTIHGLGDRPATTSSRAFVGEVFRNADESMFRGSAGRAMADAIAQQWLPDDEAARDREADRMAGIFGTDQGREFFGSDAITFEQKTEVLALARREDWDASTFEDGRSVLENETIAEALAAPRIERFAENGGHEPRALSTMDVRPEAERALRAIGGDDPDVSVVPVLYGSNAGLIDVPLYRVADQETGAERFVGPNGDRFDSFEEWERENRLPPGYVSYPQNGRIDGDGESVELASRATPRTIDTAGEVILDAADKIALGLSVTAGAATIAGTGGWAAPVVASAATLWNAGRTSADLHELHERGQSLNPFENPEAASLQLQLAGDLAAVGTFGSTSFAGLLDETSNAARMLTRTGRVLDWTAVGADGTAFVHSSFQLASNWDDLTPEQRAMQLAQSGTYFFGAANGVRNLTAPRPNVDVDVDVDVPPAQRTELSRLSDEQLRAIYPEGGATPSTLERVALEDFADFATANPTAARTLADGYDAFGDYVPDAMERHRRNWESQLRSTQPGDDLTNAQLQQARALGYESAAAEIRRYLPMTEAAIDPRYVLQTRSPDSPDWMPEVDMRATRDLDHNGAFHQLTDAGEATNVISQQRMTPNQIEVDGRRLDTMDGVMVFSDHGGTRGFQGGDTNATASVVARQIAESRAAGANIDKLVLNACHQRNRRGLVDATNNAQAFQRQLNENLRALGQPEVTVFAADRGGPTYGSSQRSYLTNRPNLARYTPAADGSQFFVSRQDALTAAAALPLEAAGAYFVYRAVTDDE